MKTKIGVFFGGRSVEHEISVISALQAIAALDTARYRPIPVYITKQGRWFTGDALLDAAAYRDMAALEKNATEVYMRPELGERALRSKKPGLLGGLSRRGKIVAEIDVALPVLHGTNGEDGTFQGLLELTGVPYAGCGVLASAIGMDKVAMKMVLRQSGIPVLDFVWFTDRQFARQRDELTDRIESEIGYPAIVKPANLGSSVGISRARDRQELFAAIETASQYSARILVERMVEPLREINCAVLGSADDHISSVCEEPMHSGEILSYADKYMSGGDGGAKGGVKTNPGAGGDGGAEVPSGGMSSTKRRIPADLTETATKEVQRLAGETFRVLDCEGVARVDFIMDGDTIFVNEINTIPGSLSFYLWEATGIGFADMIERLVAQALKRERDKSHKTVSYDANIFNMGGFGGGAKGTKSAKTGGKITDRR